MARMGKISRWIRIARCWMLNGKPLCIDGFCGLGGWAQGFLAEGWDVIGFDIERHKYCGIKEYPKRQLWLQDVLTIHGSQFKNADCLVMSPPCQSYSYLAMPWSRSKDPNNSKAAKALRRKWETEGPDNRLFDACFRIQREAIEARSQEIGCHFWHEGKSHCPECYIPLIVENVRGAQPWVGRSAWNYGSFHLWGDVPALMPFSQGRKRTGRNFHTHALTNGAVSSPSFHGGEHETRGVGLGVKIPAYSDPRRNGGKGVHLTSPAENEAGTKIGGDWFSDPQSTCRKHGSRSNARKAASAMIAKIPFQLAEWIARCYYPRQS